MPFEQGETTPGLDPDAMLMLRVAAEDYDSFAELVQRHRASVHGLLYRMLNNGSVAEETHPGSLPARLPEPPPL